MSSFAVLSGVVCVLSVVVLLVHYVTHVED